MSVELFVSILLFFVAMFIFFVVRASDMKKRSLQNVQSLIKRFRNESAATQQQLVESTQSCIDKVEDLLGRAERTGDMINSLFVSLDAHSKDLTALEGVCVNYKRALEKLRVQTEQAESRISVVREEVHKAEMINDNIKTFKNDIELISRDIDDKKTEFVNLITATSESLKKQAESELEENSKALEAFSDAIVKERESFVAFISEERDALKSESERQLEVSKELENRLTSVDERSNELVLKAEENLEKLRQAFENYYAEMEQRIEETKESVKGSFNAMKESIESSSSFLEMRRSDIEKSLEEKSDELASSFDKKLSLSEEKLSDKEKELSELLLVRSEEIKNSFSDYIPSISEARDNAIAEAKTAFENDIASLRDQTEALINDLDTKLRDSISQLENAERNISSSIALASQTGVKKVGEASSRLKDLEVKISTAESVLSSLQERITNTREEIYNNHQSPRKEEKENEKISTISIGEEGISKEKEEMFSSFPDDIILGDEEEIDLSDDD